MIEIRHKITGKVIFTYEGDTLRGANLARTNLCGANLSWSDLSEANLSETDLSGTNLSGTNLTRTNLSGATLTRTNLSETNLSGTDLSWADLSWANLNGTNLIFLETEIWGVYIFKGERIQIGCKDYTLNEWFTFSDTQIKEMSRDALTWWTKWKEPLKILSEYKLT